MTEVTLSFMNQPISALVDKEQTMGLKFETLKSVSVA